MPEILQLIIPFVLLLVLLAIGTPVAFAMLLAGGLGLLMVANFDVTFALFELTPHATTTTISYSVIPMFILMAEFLSESSIASRLFVTARAWTGRMPGGLAASTIAAGTAMGTISGSSLATTSTLARVAVREMRRVGYDERLSLSSAASGGVIAALIPPSMMLIIYGVATETSISGLFAAGVLPGLLQAGLFVALIAVWVKLRPSLAPPPTSTTWREKFASLKNTGPAILLIIMVLGGIYSGLVTVFEAGALGALGALIVAVLFGGLRFQGARVALTRAMESTAAIFFVIIGAKVFAQYVTLTGITQSLAAGIAEAGLPPLVVLIAILSLYFFMGMFMDSIGMMLLTLPIVFPLIVSLDYDPIWFGVIVVLMIEIGLLTPPLGMNVFMATSVAKADVRPAFAGAVRFVGVSLLTVVILIAAPGVATFLPGLIN
jgi:C4-dicarboxylate transporter, DctM subunit